MPVWTVFIKILIMCVSKLNLQLNSIPKYVVYLLGNFFVTYADLWESESSSNGD